ncbi:2OG-Fe(II) oxygenase [Rhodocytophaga rosea]|uniref:2OG-Fe(II) oxygenase n=1 Tax=Rhodocytophaga rosea TaxID=2704465 RepID=A0A6C0GBU3_9BACT|nr:cyclophane-containing peptide 2OG-Fe(II) oxygenase YhhC [Rhodocytophaga rosea]QHT65358.1 2OG-Fe(II) oxygenase [Rhodocytophaga rosea]
MGNNHLFNNGMFYSIPFQYFIGSNLFSNKECKRILKWLQNDAVWRLHSEYFFDQYEAVIKLNDQLFSLKDLINFEWVDKIKVDLSLIFGCTFNDFFVISCRKYISTQEIGIHNDDSIQPSHETHRVVIYFNEGYRDEFGGHLVLFNSKNKKDIHKILRPLNNSYFGFATSKDSYHAVTRINQNVRYTINLSFWDSRYSNIEVELFDLISCNKKISSEKIYLFLIESGAKKTNHSSRDIYTHLVGTANILQKIDTNTDLVLAGLFHSIYGTSCFEALNFPLNRREKIIELIGSEAERISYLYCLIERKHLYVIFKNGSEQNVLLRNGQEDFITLDDLRNLFLLDCANSLEQYISIGSSFDEIKDDLSFYLSFKNLLSNNNQDKIKEEYLRLLNKTYESYKI